MRIRQSATINIEAPLADAFPLFGPIREKDWAYGWNPEVIYPKDCTVEKHMTFRTHGGLQGTAEPYTWVIVTYDPKSHIIEHMVSAADRFWFINVSCTAVQSKTEATVTYSYTGLTPGAHRKNEIALREMFASNLKDWEAAINYYLKTGKQLT